MLMRMCPLWSMLRMVREERRPSPTLESPLPRRRTGCSDTRLDQVSLQQKSSPSRLWGCRMFEKSINFKAVRSRLYPWRTPRTQGCIDTSTSYPPAVASCMPHKLLFLSQIINLLLRRDFLYSLPTEWSLYTLTFIKEPKFPICASHVSKH